MSFDPIPSFWCEGSTPNGAKRKTFSFSCRSMHTGLKATWPTTLQSVSPTREMTSSMSRSSARLDTSSFSFFGNASRYTWFICSLSEVVADRIFTSIVFWHQEFSRISKPEFFIQRALNVVCGLELYSCSRCTHHKHSLCCSFIVNINTYNSAGSKVLCFLYHFIYCNRTSFTRFCLIRTRSNFYNISDVLIPHASKYLQPQWLPHIQFLLTNQQCVLVFPALLSIGYLVRLDGSEYVFLSNF